MTTKMFRSAAAVLFALLPVSAASAASPVEDVAQHFTNLDRNQDGVMSGTEVRGTVWERYDTDGNGEVSRIEFVGGRAFDKRYAETAPNPQQAWLVLDWNNDGYLSGTELDGKWERLDADGDGKVQKHEFITARTGPAVFPAPPGDVSAPPATPPNTPRPTYIPPPADASNPGVTPAPNGPRPNYIPPPADGPGVAPVGPADGAQAKSLWGGSIAAAQKSDLFQFFNLVRFGQAVPLQAGTQWSFQPKQGPFRELVIVHLTESADKRIVAAELLLAGSFVNSPKTDVFARDIAKSFVAQLTPGPQAGATRDLVNELWHGAPNQVRVDGTPAPKLPDPPTAAYQTYLGKRESHEQALGDVKLFINSAQAADEWLTISFQPAQEAGM